MRSACLLLAVAPLFAADPTPAIRVDQVGYLPQSPKIAFVAAPSPAAAFTIRRVSNNAVAFEGKLPDPIADPDSGDRLQLADFSALTRDGRYYLDVPGVGRSWPFEIGSRVYSRAWYLAMRSFYGQRCGIAVDLGPEFPGYQYDVCHRDAGWHASSGRSEGALPKGGWHDAGDYGRYIVNSGITTGTLLWTWELYSDRLKDVGLDIPESKNRTPDMLDEIRWNLDWMLGMQDADGGVWHKQTSEKFTGFVMPDKDALMSYVIGTGAEPFKSSCASADFAAVMAIAARVYRPYDADFAARALKAAEHAWTWLEANPNVTFRNPQPVATGAYGDGNCADERLWAAAELSRATHAEPYRRYFLDQYAAQRNAIRPTNPPAWANVGALALWTYALDPAGDPDAIAAIRQDSLAAADQIVDRSRANGYRISLTARDYIWGSNSVVANYGMQLLIANAFKPDPRYVETALENLHYLLGRNTFSLSFVTQVGANPFRNPHHRPSGADTNSSPWPGLLSGGPNRSPQDPAMRKLPAGLPPAKMYIDDQESYASNEIAINWNAPLVFLLAGAQPEK